MLAIRTAGFVNGTLPWRRVLFMADVRTPVVRDFPYGRRWLGNCSCSSSYHLPGGIRQFTALKRYTSINRAHTVSVSASPNSLCSVR